LPGYRPATDRLGEVIVGDAHSFLRNIGSFIVGEASLGTFGMT
jgi:hypothetical protein